MASAPTRDRARERERRAREEWRGGYSSKGYVEARARALERSRGRCEACGAVVFERSGRGWRKAACDFGGTHHVVPLSHGGTNDPSNVVVLCARCHGLAHSRPCAGCGDAGELLDAIGGM